MPLSSNALYGSTTLACLWALVRHFPQSTAHPNSGSSGISGLVSPGGPEVGPIIPSLEGSIDWQPLAFNPGLGYLYFMSNQWAMGYKFWEKDKFKPPTNGEWSTRPCTSIPIEA